MTNGSLESQISSICDDIAYNNNDIDDGLYANFFKIDDLEQLDLVKVALKKIKISGSYNNSRIKYELVRNLIKLMIDDLIENTKKNLEKYKIKTTEDIENCEKKLVCFSEKMTIQEKKLKEFLKKKMYMHPTIKTMNIKSKKLFQIYLNYS